MAVSAAQAEKMIHENINNPKFVLVDVRTEPERKAARLPDSIHVPLSDIEYRMGDFKKENTYLVYCRSGARSDAACVTLRKHGINAINLSGGIMGWGNRPTESG
jgi:rhodanese-related sulfurtransferase